MAARRPAICKADRVEVHLLPDRLDPAVDEDLVGAVCRSHFGQLGVNRAVELSGGLYNTTLRLDLSDTSSVILRIGPAEKAQRPSERHLLRNEVASIPLLQDVADLMPSTHIADFSHQVIPRDYVVQSFLLGTPGTEVEDTWDEEAMAHLWRDIGTILHRVHARTSTAFGRIIGPAQPSWPQALGHELQLMAEGCADLGLSGDDLHTIAEVAVEDAALATAPSRLLHGDLGPGNVMVDADHPERGVTGVYDCDRTSWGDRWADITFAYVERLSPRLQEAFWGGYQVRPPRLPERVRLYYLARTLGEARLQHARLGRTRQLGRTYELMAPIALRLAA